MSQHQTLYVHVFPSRLFAAHWSFWIPCIDDTGAEQDTGYRIHVTGDRLNGFKYEYINDYDPREDDRLPKAHAIGRIPAAALRRPESEDKELDCANVLDQALRAIEAPGPSLNKVTPNSGAGDGSARPKKMEVRDCQWWIKQAVEHLVEEGMLAPITDGEGVSQAIESPIVRVSKLPKH